MRPLAVLASVIAIGCGFTLLGCVDDSAEIKQKIAELEKKIQKQEKDLKDFSGKFGPPRDFSADIQRMEDQQEKITQAIKSKVDPVNSKLEEFRDWAQDAQKERDNVTGKIKAVEQSTADLRKRLEAENKELVKLVKEFAANKKTATTSGKTLEDLTKSVAEIRREVLDNNTKLVAAVKKTLPKVKDAAVAELKDRLQPLEEGLNNLRTSIESDKNTLVTLKAQPGAAGSSKEVQELSRRIKELEDVAISQKTYLLEVGSKVHELEIQFRRSSQVDQLPPAAAVSRR